MDSDDDRYYRSPFADLATSTWAIVCLLLVSGCASSALDTEWHEFQPFWKALPVPLREHVAKAKIVVPHGHRLCGVIESTSTIRSYYVPLDKNVRCEDLPLPIERGMPDVVLIAPTPDAPLLYESTKDLVEDEPFYCHGMSYDYPASARKPVSNTQTTISPVGRLLARLETTACVREDVGNDRYTKAYLAYRPNPAFIGHSYVIATDVHREHKAQADKLLNAIVKSFKLLD
jgi:hypothetical protein